MILSWVHRVRNFDYDDDQVSCMPAPTQEKMKLEKEEDETTVYFRENDVIVSEMR